MNEQRSGWVTFAGALLLIAGALNVIYGIAAIGDSKFFTEHGTYIISGLNTWGWVLTILGVIEPGISTYTSRVSGRRRFATSSWPPG